MIAYAMLYAAVAGVPILLVAVLEASFLRTHGKAERWVWAAALVVALALPFAVLMRPEVTLPAAETAVVAVVESELRPVLVVPAPAERRSDFDPTTMLLAFWMAASAGFAARASVSWLKLLRERGEWVRQRLDGVRVSLSTDVGPGVYGLLRPRIVIPSWVAEMPADRRAFVLQHEVEHLRGRDHWLSALARAARIAAPWNPIVWLLTSKLGRAVELDCDRRVLRVHPDVAGYGATLLLVSERRSSALALATAFAMSDKPLRERIIAMTAPTRRFSVMGLAAALVVGAVLLISALRVPVPAMGAPTVRLNPVGASAPAQPSAPAEAVTRPETGENTLAQVADAQPTRPLDLASLPRLLQQVAQQVLPEPQLITDQSRALFLLPDTLSNERRILRRLGYGVAGDGDGMLLPRGSEAVQFLQDERLVMVPLGDNVSGLNLLSRPFPGGPPREITQIPQVLNPGDIISAIAAAYPPSLRDRGLGGTVGVRFLVGEAGEVRNIRISAIAAYYELTEAAGRVAQVYRFSPARAGDAYVAVWVSHAIDFRVP